METFLANALCSFHIVKHIDWTTGRSPRCLTFYQCFIPNLASRTHRLNTFSCNFIEEWSLRHTRASIIFFVVNLIGLAFIDTKLIVKTILLPSLAFFINIWTFFEVEVPFESIYANGHLAQSRCPIKIGFFREARTSIILSIISMIEFTPSYASFSIKVIILPLITKLLYWRTF